ncbi:hypothetical protein GCM10010964_20270 [Caldovatus sediminis]|uniref:Cytochrome c-type biogenesis protein n=1 Tax=Caldovatus sediminis TaxID=2041189 RepID=A0A8J3EC80_9PROT|nr:hypothetical protein GCM10010964_20270 [Caldovatus sediminis]
MTTIRPRRAAILPALLLAPLLFPAAAPAAVGDPRERLADPAQEARARAIGRELRCLVCQNQSIEDSNADLARDLRLIVRERIAQGATDAEVVRYLHERYGDFVLLRPPVTAATALLWAAPALALAGGATAILLALRRRRVAPDAVVEEAAAPLTEAERARLAAIEAAAAERDRRPS